MESHIERFCLAEARKPHFWSFPNSTGITSMLDILRKDKRWNRIEWFELIKLHICLRVYPYFPHSLTSFCRTQMNYPIEVNSNNPPPSWKMNCWSNLSMPSSAATGLCLLPVENLFYATPRISWRWEAPRSIFSSYNDFRVSKLDILLFS